MKVLSEHSFVQGQSEKLRGILSLCDLFQLFNCWTSSLNYRDEQGIRLMRG